MARFFVEAIDPTASSAVITGRDAEHIKVLRMRPGEQLTLCDGKGTEALCVLTESGKAAAYADVLEVRPCVSESTVPVHIFAGLAKGDRVDYVVQKCTELGAHDITLFHSQRCIVRLDPKKGADAKLTRLRRIAEEAAKQSGRGIIPQVRYLDSFGAMLEQAGESRLKLFLYETGERTSLRDAVRTALPFESAAIVTGPEGGFTPEEAQAARAAGFAVCAMGPRILRCETAPLIPLTAVLYETGNLD